MNDESNDEMSLLDKFRRDLIDVEGLIAEYLDDDLDERPRMRQFVELLIKHKTEFPMKLRPTLMSAESDGNIDHAEEFCKYFIDEVVGPFLRGRSEDTPSVWHGANCDVDTKEEVALALVILFVCDGLRELDWDNDFLTTHTKALPFVPLYLETLIEVVELWSAIPHIAELSECIEDDYEDLLCRLCDDRDVCTDYHFLKPSAELDRARFDLLCQMKEEKWIKAAVTEYVFEKVLGNGARLLVDDDEREPEFNDPTFFEQKLRLFIQLKPEILSAASDGTIHRCYDMMTYEVLTELGMLYFPGVLGFVFHGDYFERACARFGSEKVLQIVHKHISMNLKWHINDRGHRRTIEACATDGEYSMNGGDGNLGTAQGYDSHTFPFKKLLFAAATNVDISRDGLYALLQNDPSMLSVR